MGISTEFAARLKARQAGPDPFISTTATAKARTTTTTTTPPTSGGGEVTITWKASATTFTSSGSVVTMTAKETIYITRAASSKPTSQAGQTDLSRGAIAGIVIGALVAIVAAATVVFFCMRSRRRRQRTEAQETENDTQNGMAKADIDGNGIAELHDDPTLFEARDGVRYEIAAPVAELEGDTRKLGRGPGPRKSEKQQEKPGSY